MIPKEDLFLIGDQERIWGKYCGFFNLSVREFMEIQEQLLTQQLDLIAESPLAMKFMKVKPKSVAEFRQLRFTTFDDYATELNSQNEALLAVKPYCWGHTSGRGGGFKWIPYTEEAMIRTGIASIGLAILACTEKKGEVNIGAGLRILHNLPSPPYLSGILVDVVPKMMDARVIPPPEKYTNVDFQLKIKDGFQMALRTGVDFLTSLTSVLVKMGERFTESSRQMKLNRGMMHPIIIGRLIRAWLQSKKEHRPILPKDLWPLKGLCCFGMDTSIYKDKLRYFWGKEPLECYATTETGLIATAAWNKKYMTFTPYSCFLEFIPESELLKSKSDSSYQPRTVLLNEVNSGERYEIVISSFYGMPLMRYRIGDFIKIVALTDEQAGIHLPQMVFDSRADGIIDIGGFTRLDEKIIWQAIINTKVKFEEWTIRKEYIGKDPAICLYIELKEDIAAAELRDELDQRLTESSHDYREMKNMLGINPINIKLLPSGTFFRFYEDKQKKGLDLAHLKPPHMNASDEIINDLVRLAH